MARAKQVASRKVISLFLKKNIFIFFYLIGLLLENCFMGSWP